MKHNRLTTLLLALVVALSLTVTVSAADDAVLTRGEFVTALYGASGTTGTSPAQSVFSDVPAEGTLAQAVSWAADNGIVNGLGDGRFGPEDPVTREQMVTMLYRFAQSLGQDPQGQWMFPLGFRDAETVSAWADKAVQWAVMNRIIVGSGSELMPKATATDDQLVAVMDRWNSFLTPEGESRGVMILYTSDVHCGIEKGFGYAGFWEVKNALIAQGYDVILVDDGDNIQGETIGTMTKGAALMELMDQMGYSVAIPGNHEFDYGMDTFLSLADAAKHTYISCNFVHNGRPVFERYAIRELGGKKIAFVGVTTPLTITSSTPTNFQDENGQFVYGFLQDQTGEAVYQAVQSAVNDARAEGADFVIVLAHLGNEAESFPWTYADVISHTTGIDAFLDGHSHDTDQVIMKNAAGALVPRSACGTKLESIGWCSISPDGKVVTGLYSWNREEPAPTALGLDNELSRAVSDAFDELDETLNTVVGRTGATLTINDPTAVDSSGKPIRIVRQMETNLGDLVADAYRQQAVADIGFMNGGGIRTDIRSGDITLNDLYSVLPFGNTLCMVEATGQQILDALEWGARAVPGESGAFLHVSGLSYEIDTTVDSTCTENEYGMFTGVTGERRVKNVLVGGEPIDPDRTYTLAAHNYMLLQHGDGYTMFDSAPLLLDGIKLDNQLLIDYIVNVLGGVIGEEYANPYGQGRITFTSHDN